MVAILLACAVAYFPSVSAAPGGLTPPFSPDRFIPSQPVLMLPP